MKIVIYIVTILTPFMVWISKRSRRIGDKHTLDMDIISSRDEKKAIKALRPAGKGGVQFFKIGDHMKEAYIT